MKGNVRSKTCALRAPTAFSARTNDIRAENAVSVDGKSGSWSLFKIVDCAGKAFFPLRNRRSARTVSCPRNNTTAYV